MKVFLAVLIALVIPILSFARTPLEVCLALQPEKGLISRSDGICMIYCDEGYRNYGIECVQGYETRGYVPVGERSVPLPIAEQVVALKSKNVLLQSDVEELQAKVQELEREVSFQENVATDLGSQISGWRWYNPFTWF